MGKYTPPKSTQTFEEVAPEETKAVSEEVKANVAENYTVKDGTVTEMLTDKIDNFVDLLSERRNVPSENYGKEQLLFMGALDETLKLDYPEFASVMDNLVNRVRVDRKAFRMERLFIYTQHPDVKKAKTDAYVQKHIALLSAVVTLGRNLRDRQRVGRQVDIVMLTKGYHPRVAQNLQNYFSKMYS
ncbi:hypothetical protein [Vibrio phage pTD1]|uniref:Uncharacterized protein n=1 Tax=Vibrio phage pTD1 TaxID=1938577 RepID=A0A1Q2U2X6_9CAUD|nr:hypothetical protein FDH33_gp104 [Vibrio phage pTD1]BAW98313.1 hypothetical protein [Vibrio phage pTD1]